MLLESPTGQYSAMNARTLAFLANAAYLPADQCQGECAKVGVENFRFIDERSTDTQLFIAADAESIVISFRGTSNLRDAITDCDCRRALTLKGALVHEGFNKAVLSVWNEMRAHLKSIPDGPKLFLTGHSLGGALAQLTAYLLPNFGHEISGVYTFGQPRVGNLTFAKCYDSILGHRTFRIVDKEDLVPRVPWLCRRYVHTETEVFFNEWGGRQIDPSIWPKLLSDAIGCYRAWKAKHEVLIADHALAKYLALVGSAPIQALNATQYQIIKEISRAVHTLGGDLGLLAILGSWGDTLSESEILSMLQEWNAQAHSVIASPNKSSTEGTK